MKAQIKMGETLAVMVVFFFLIVFGFGFFVKLQTVSYRVQLVEQTDVRAVEVAQKVTFLPELQCSSKNIIVPNCVDLLKAEAFEAMQDEATRIEYYDIFGFADVKLTQTYPSDEGPYVLYENPEIGKNRLRTTIPVTIYNATGNQFNFGIIEVDVYG